MAVGSVAACMLERPWRNEVNTPSFPHSSALISATARLGKEVLVGAYSAVDVEAFDRGRHLE